MKREKELEAALRETNAFLFGASIFGSDGWPEYDKETANLLLWSNNELLGDSPVPVSGKESQ